MIPREILRQIKQIEIRTKRLVNDLFGGEYQSIFKGRGIEFADVREYVPGDDIRTIDWNVTARSQHPFVKKYVEERELTVLFIVDRSGSQQFGTTDKFKATIAAEVCALLAFSAIRSNDKVGLLMFTDRIEKFVPLKKGRSHALRVVREVLFHHAEGSKTNVELALKHVEHVLKRRAIIFIISDFLDAGFEKSLRVLAKRHDVIAIQLIDPREQNLPSAGMMEIEDIETGQSKLIDTRSKKFREEYQRLVAERSDRIDQLFKSMGVDKIQIRTQESYIDPLMKFFRKREREFR